MACPGVMLMDVWEDEGGSVPEEEDVGPIYKDPFLGKCIHGVEGARISGGVQINPNCDECRKDGRGDFA